jgi:hypothetical protein
MSSRRSESGDDSALARSPALGCAVIAGHFGRLALGEDGFAVQRL